MKYTPRAFSLVSAILIINLLTAQTGEWCGSDVLLKERIAANAQNAQQWEDFKNMRMEPGSSAASRAANEIIYIPVVFHIIYDNDAVGTGENISDAQVLSQLDAMNLYFNYGDPQIANVPLAFQHLVGTCGIKFCIAKFDENGDPTNGIIRHPFPNVTSWDDRNDIENTLKPSTIWDVTRYLNIWSINMGGQLVADGLLGYSSFPGFTNASEDGIVARHTNIGTTPNVQPQFRKGKTVTHEVGHWLGLIHVWGLDNGMTCGDVGDLIDDTPDQADMNYGCPNVLSPPVSCNNGPNGDMFMNYMDYTNDACSNMFTIKQAEAMRNTLNTTRASIKNSNSVCYFSLDASVLKVLLPADTICSLSFSPVVTIRNEGTTPISSGKFYFDVDGAGTQIVNWSGLIGMQQEAQITLPLQTVTDGSHSFTVTFGNVNGQSSDGFSGNDSKTSTFIAYDGASAAVLPVVENFENSFPPFNWSIYNPNGDVVKWVRETNNGGFGQSNNCIAINNLGYSTNPGSRKDAFITEGYDFSGIAYPELRFDVAYAQHSANRSDSLNIYYSLDCGSNWIKVWNQSGRELATDTFQSTLFIPDPAEWKTVSIPMIHTSGQSKVSFKFENVADWGNMMYIDNLNIRNNPGLSVKEVKRSDIKVFPNPAGTLAAVRLPANHSFGQLQLINMMGEVVYQTEIADDALIFSVENFSSGLYFLRLEGNIDTYTEKLLIAK